jgi:glycosyltransferase involved in cell wall biosynthesis
MKYDTIDVVIPARNEGGNIGMVLSVLKLHPAIGTVIVVADADTTDDTAALAREALDAEDMVLTEHDMRGKGQCVTHGLRHVSSEYVIFCDADITGLTVDHVSALTLGATTGEYSMTIGVPEVAHNLPTERIWAWRWVSGQRCVPTILVRRMKLHGYLMETQLNSAARFAEMPVTFTWLSGLHSPYRMTEQRLQEMERDAKYGLEHGILL